MRLIFRNPLYGRCGDEASKAVPGDGYPGIRRKATKGAGKSTPEPEPESTATLRGSRYQPEALPRKPAKLNHAAASTANRHRWSGKRIPRRMGDSRLRN